MLPDPGIDVLIGINLTWIDLVVTQPLVEGDRPNHLDIGPKQDLADPLTFHPSFDMSHQRRSDLPSVKLEQHVQPAEDPNEPILQLLDEKVLSPKLCRKLLAAHKWIFEPLAWDDRLAEPSN